MFPRIMTRDHGHLGQKWKRVEKHNVWLRIGAKAMMNFIHTNDFLSVLVLFGSIDYLRRPHYYIKKLKLLLTLILFNHDIYGI